MYVLITYDVSTVTMGGQKRLRKVAKACQNYGQRVQNSVFECLISESQFLKLKDKILQIIDEGSDSIRFYHLGNNWNHKIEKYGKITSFEIDGELII